MKTILSVMFAMMVGLTFVGSTFADDEEDRCPGRAHPLGEVKKGDATKKADDAKAADKDAKKKKEAGDKEKH